MPQKTAKKQQKLSLSLYLDRVVDRLGQVAPQARHRARKVERRRRRVHGGTGNTDGGQGVVGGVFQDAVGRDVPVHKGVSGRVEQGLSLRRGLLRLVAEAREGRHGPVLGRVDGGEVFDGGRDDDLAARGRDLERGGGDDLVFVCLLFLFVICCWWCF